MGQTPKQEKLTINFYQAPEEAEPKQLEVKVVLNQVLNTQNVALPVQASSQETRNTFTSLSSFTRLKDKIKFHYLPDEIKESI